MHFAERDDARCCEMVEREEAALKVLIAHQQLTKTVEPSIEDLRVVSNEAGMSMATLAVCWVLSNPAVIAPIIGASRPEQLADSLAAAEKDRSRAI